MDTYTTLYTYYYYTAVEIRPKTKCLYVLLWTYIYYTYNNIICIHFIRAAGAVSGKVL